MLGDPESASAPSEFLSAFMEILAGDPEIVMSDFSEIDASDNIAAISFAMSSEENEAFAHWSVVQTDSGFGIIAGFTQAYGAGGTATLIKTDSNGNEMWNRTFGGADWDFIFVANLSCCFVGLGYNTL